MLGFFLATFAVATLAYEGLTYLLWCYETRVHGGPSPRGSWLVYATAWSGDWAALAFLVPASVLGSLGALLGAPSTSPPGTPVVLVHGWGATRGAMALVAARLRRDGRRAHTISYPSMAADIEASATALRRVLQELAATSDTGRLDVLAHGRGALVLKAAVRQGCAALLRNVVTLGAPHQGTALAALIDARCLRQLQPGCRYLTQLEQDLDEVAAASQWTSIRSTFDAVVFPTELTYQARALNIAIDWVGHHALLLSERAYRLAKENLDVDALRG